MQPNQRMREPVVVPLFVTMMLYELGLVVVVE